MIDLIRGRRAALAFIAGFADTPCLSAVTATELIAGVRSLAEQRQVDELIETYIVHDIDLDTAVLAGDYLRRFRPSHGIGALDALIAATATVRGLELATLNLKHFPMFEGLRRPYAP